MKTGVQASKATVALAVIAAALGFFVDAYDLLLYSIVRMESLASFGLSGSRLLDTGIDLLNAQLFGMLAGGVLFGVIGDLHGRRKVLFGSIVLYSAATFANGFASTIPAYAICRFAAGVGLSGELGAGVTLVAELMSSKNRGYGTMIVAAIGVLGVVAASLVGSAFPWRTAYFIGGGLGFLLLLLRLGVSESGLFDRARAAAVPRGNFFMLFTNAERFRRYARLILLAMPIWYAIGVLITLSPELGLALGLQTAPQAGKAVLFYYSGLTIGDMLNGLSSQLSGSRKRAILLFMLMTVVSCCGYFLFGNRSLVLFYCLCGIIGLTCGYWAMFVTIAAESFGTNLRATVAITAPNFVRGLTALLTLAFKFLTPRIGAVTSAACLGAAVMALAFVALSRLTETYGRDLDYLEK